MSAANPDLQQALAARGPEYKPRTRHLNEDSSPVYTNRLILEDSPYLLQHAHNPVNWYAWGEAAFIAAREQDKPLFLSVGYSTCHWCHVMEQESFESEAIAAILNEHFIAIKVDREQRPDVDDTYMMAVLLTMGQGGWPMSVWLTPEAKPFAGGTYFPPAQFAQVLQQVAQLWQNRRDELLTNAAQLTRAIQQQQAARAGAEALDLDAAVATATARLLQRHDEAQGGFSTAPKFPNEALLLFLLDKQRRQPSDEIGQALATTLDALQRGGIHDQAAGGFHRYSTDPRWLVPHFEKMLYNQALLGKVFAEAHALTGNAGYAHTATLTLEYVLREMTAPGGAFYSATDADSADENGAMHEGLYFVWTPEQIHTALPSKDAELAMQAFGITESGNFEGRNILHLPQSISELAAQQGQDEAQLRRRLDDIRRALREARASRPAPLRDDKIITAWNGMMIATLAHAARLLDCPRYLEAAQRAADFLLDEHVREDGGLWRASLDGRASVVAAQEDYAWLALALIALYDASGEARWLQEARRFTDRMIDDFADSEHGGFYMSVADPDVPLATRPRDSNDGATPSGNAIALQVLAALFARSGEQRYREQADRLLAGFAGRIAQQPDAFASMLIAAMAMREGETTLPLYAARGRARIDVRELQVAEDSIRGKVKVRLDRDWHIQAQEPNQADYIGTTLAAAEGWTLESADYPQAAAKAVDFLDQPLLLLSGEVAIPFRLRGSSDAPAALTLTLQACDDKLCLPPETIRVPLAGTGL